MSRPDPGTWHNTRNGNLTMTMGDLRLTVFATARGWKWLIAGQRFPKPLFGLTMFNHESDAMLEAMEQGNMLR